MRFPYGYYLLCVFVYLIALPFLVISSFRQKHRYSLPARFFTRDLNLTYKPHYWFHACSFGEVKSLEPIISALKKTHTTILITTITQTGYEEAKRLYETSDSKDLGHQEEKGQVMVKYLPFELFLPVWNRYLDELKCLIVTEAEIWKMLFFVAKAHNAHTMLINARISERSLKNYLRLKWFYRGVFKTIDSVLAQSQLDKSRLEMVGAHNVEVFGNLKVLNAPKLGKSYVKPPAFVVMGASTHKGEEKLILQAFMSLKKTTPDAILLIAPRHPERFSDVYQSLLQSSLRVARFSQKGLEAIESAEVILVDVLGELVNLYAISDVVILGGAFAKVGGHNPLEPAFFHTKLISGEYIFNQRALFECVKNAYIIPPEKLEETLLNHKNLSQSSVECASDDKLHQLLEKITHANR
ncbi:3-deoxy-D-manno-octulosonic acid transferase [Helicobacter sp. MIT 05-5293]|uniref:lipid IV(A) 3-deoxy-D-manno-octulosonic acid transferase n=1 Tax=Helicobacter sp. MIT 05-5293 TaxID=1548149 RepID=UPI00068C3FF6|nr:lipid IV(A) 3-deoxy-D-manno-octulosonic acid transferase [Helicobacter sp. MIT 05-5293]TLD80260.1 3-deoxy-D-manno-octulosonic acid transferase [Helicobacter sp. MIT 05-5293]